MLSHSNCHSWENSPYNAVPVCRYSRNCEFSLAVRPAENDFECVWMEVSDAVFWLALIFFPDGHEARKSVLFVFAVCHFWE